MKMFTGGQEPNEVALWCPQLSPTDSESQVPSPMCTCPQVPGHTGLQPHRCRFSGVGLGALGQPSPPPSTLAAASAQFSSSLTSVPAAVAPSEEILSFAQPQGTRSCPEQLEGGG